MGLLYAKSHPISERLSLSFPTVGDVLDNHDEFYSVLSMFVVTPYDLMVQLDDQGIDFTTISQYQLFFSMMSAAIEHNASEPNKGLELCFSGVDWSEVRPAVDVTAQAYVFVDKDNNVVLDEFLYRKTRATICKLYDIDSKNKKPANETARKYMLERARKKQESAKRKIKVSNELEDHIVALVNSAEFKYDFESVRSLSLYMFTRSLNQILRRVNYEQVMHGYYAGTLDIKKVNQDTLNWLSPN